MPIGDTSQRRISGPASEINGVSRIQAKIPERELVFSSLFDEETAKVTLISIEGTAFRVEKKMLSTYR
jgi:hypothetical protein